MNEHAQWDVYKTLSSIIYTYGPNDHKITKTESIAEIKLENKLIFVRTTISLISTYVLIFDS